VLRRDLRASDTYAVTISHDAVAHSLIENAAGATVEIVEGHTLTLGGNLTDSAGTPASSGSEFVEAFRRIPPVN